MSEEQNQINEENNELNTDGYTLIRNTLLSASLGILKYIAIVFPRFLFHWTVVLFPNTVKFIFRAVIILLLLAVLAALLGWPYIYWFVYHPNESKELCTIIEIVWLLLIGIPGAYLGIRSRKKWFARLKAWRQRRQKKALPVVNEQVPEVVESSETNNAEQ